jgi:UDP-3-O-[3-hydroxymyristoyl] glucosamine N-acyltransferase
VPDTAVSLSLGEIAVRFGCVLRGDPERRVSGVGTLAGGPHTVGFLANPARRDELRAAHLGAAIIRQGDLAACPDAVAALVHDNPHATFARLAALLHPLPPVKPGIHPGALVDQSARVAPSAEVGPFALIGAGAVIGERCRVGAHAIVGERVRVGEDTRLAERASILDGCSIGARCHVQAGAVIGSDGFGNARDGVVWLKVPQLGSVRIGDDVEIGANTTIDRGALDDTVIEDGVRLDNLIQVAHNVRIGAHTAIAGCVGIAGSTRIGKRCMIGGGAGIGGQLTLGDDIVIGGFGQVTHSIAAAGMYSSVVPVEEMRLWRRIVGRVKRIEQLVARVGRLEAAAQAGSAEGQQEDDNG